MLTILDRLMANAKLLGLAAVLVVLALATGTMLVYRHERDSARAELSQAQLDAARAQVKAVDDARLEEQRRTAAQTEIANVATKDAETARADARAADAASERLRVRVAELLAASRAAGNPSPASAGQTAGDPLDVLTLMFSRLDGRAGELAEYADDARIAGQACERAYDSLTNGAAK